MQLRDTKAKIKYFSSRRAEQSDSYKEYLVEGGPPESDYSNVKNLFDDSNSEDMKWLQLAMKHLSAASK